MFLRTLARLRGPSPRSSPVLSCTKYSSFPGNLKTIQDCYDLFYLDDSCSLEELRAAYTTTIKRHSYDVANVQEIDKAYYRVLQDIAKNESHSRPNPDAAKSAIAAEYWRNKETGATTYSGHFSKQSASLESMVEGMVDRSMDESEIRHLSGFGKPLKQKDKLPNPFLDPVEAKLNEIMVNQNVGTEWIEIKKDIRERLHKARYALTDKRKKLERRSIGQAEWEEALQEFRDKLNEVNKKVNDYNLAVPLLRMQIMGYRAERELEKLEAQWEAERPSWRK